MVPRYRGAQSRCPCVAHNPKSGQGNTPEDLTLSSAFPTGIRQEEGKTTTSCNSCCLWTGAVRRWGRRKTYSHCLSSYATKS